jgi:hypothetical protein
MRYFEIASGVQIPICSEETDLLDTVSKGPVEADSFDERQRELARMMRSRGLLVAFRKNDKTFYKSNSANDIWRDRDDGC